MSNSLSTLKSQLTKIKFQNVQCRKCNNLIKIDDSVISHRSHKTKYYHADCWNKLFH